MCHTSQSSLSLKRVTVFKVYEEPAEEIAPEEPPEEAVEEPVTVPPPKGIWQVGGSLFICLYPLVLCPSQCELVGVSFLDLSLLLLNINSPVFSDSAT